MRGTLIWIIDQEALNTNSVTIFFFGLELFFITWIVKDQLDNYLFYMNFLKIVSLPALPDYESGKQVSEWFISL